RRARLLRAQAGRGQDPPRGAPLPQTPGQRRRLRPAPGRRPPRRGRPGLKEPGRATGERLHRPRGRLTPPRTGTSAKPLPDPATTLRPSAHRRSGHNETPPNRLTQRGFVIRVPRITSSLRPIKTVVLTPSTERRVTQLHIWQDLALRGD